MFSFYGVAFGGLAAGVLAATAFASRASDNLAQDADDRFVYNEADDTLWYDADGSALGASAVLIADITANAVVTAGDIFIV